MKHGDVGTKQYKLNGSRFLKPKHLSTWNLRGPIIRGHHDSSKSSLQKLG